MIRGQTEAIGEIKQNKRKQKRENIVEDIDLGRFFESATTNKRYVNGLTLHEVKSEVVKEYTGELELIGSMLIG